MGRIVVTEYVTLDGVMEAPGGGEDFEHAGWTFRTERGPGGDAFKLDETRRSAALLFGRVTYEGMAAVWPHMSGEFADMFNALPKFVVSRTLTDASRNNTEVLDGDLVEGVTALKERVEGDIVVHGSGTLVHALLEHDLVDEWFGAVPGTVRLDPRPGGEWSMELEGGPHECLSGTYVDVVPEQRLVMTTRFDSGDTVMEMRFAATGSGSRIEVRQDCHTPSGREGARAGSEYLLDRCASYLATR